VVTGGLSALVMVLLVALVVAVRYKPEAWTNRSTGADQKPDDTSDPKASSPTAHDEV